MSVALLRMAAVWVAISCCFALTGVNAVAATKQGKAPSTSAKSALSALDSISEKEWLSESSITLLGRVIAASSKAALDEAAKNDARAQALAGSGYLVGAHGYPQNNDRAALFLKAGAFGGNVIAQVNYGVMLQDGRAGRTDWTALAGAREHFNLAARQGHPVASFNLAVFNRDGIATEQNYSEAIRLFKLAASTPNIRQGQAYYELGRLYDYGTGVAKDEDAAEKYYGAAAELSHAESLYRLGELRYIDAVYVESQELFDFLKDASEEFYRLAFVAFQRDAGAGDTYAMRRLGDLYRMGYGVGSNYEEAYRSYGAAADRGDTTARLMTGRMLFEGQGVKKNEAAAVAIYKALADAGDVGGQMELAALHLAGKGGVKKDIAEAIRLYTLAARQGDARAQSTLKTLGKTW